MLPDGNLLDLYSRGNIVNNEILGTLSFNCNKWKIECFADEIEIRFLKNNESRKIKKNQDFKYYLRMKRYYMLFKNNDILFVSHGEEIAYVFTYHFNENNNKITLSHFHHFEDKEFSISPLIIRALNSVMNGFQIL